VRQVLDVAQAVAVLVPAVKGEHQVCRLWVCMGYGWGLSVGVLR
jgi:hypothetical protein